MLRQSGIRPLADDPRDQTENSGLRPWAPGGTTFDYPRPAARRNRDRRHPRHSVADPPARSLFLRPWFRSVGRACRSGLSRALLIAWQWERVDVTNSLFSMLLQGLRSDLMTLGLFAAPVSRAVAAAAGDRPGELVGRALCCAWLSLSLILIVFLELATPQFLIEYDSRPNRLFLEYLVYPQRSDGDALERLSRAAAADRSGRWSRTELAGRAALHEIRARHDCLADAHDPAAVADRRARAVRHDSLQLSAPAGQPRHVRVLRRRDGQQPGRQLGVFGADCRVRPEERSPISQMYGDMPAAEIVQRVRAGHGRGARRTSLPTSCRRCIGRSRACAASSRSTWSSCWKRAWARAS